LQYEEGWGPLTSLHAALLEASGAPTANVLMHEFYNNNVERKDFAAYAKLVDAAARAGDQVALEIIQTAAISLMRYISGVYNQLFPNHEVVPIVRVGDVFKSEILSQQLKDIVQSEIACPLRRPQLSPAAGALLEALRLDENRHSLSGLGPED
jgi:N-acetylglucosamine kinase